jgi:hypothetical protein
MIFSHHHHHQQQQQLNKLLSIIRCDLLCHRRLCSSNPLRGGILSSRIACGGGSSGAVGSVSNRRDFQGELLIDSCMTFHLHVSPLRGCMVSSCIACGSDGGSSSGAFGNASNSGCQPFYFETIKVDYQGELLLDCRINFQLPVSP